MKLGTVVIVASKFACDVRDNSSIPSCFLKPVNLDEKHYGDIYDHVNSEAIIGYIASIASRLGVHFSKYFMTLPTRGIDDEYTLVVFCAKYKRQLGTTAACDDSVINSAFADWSRANFTTQVLISMKKSGSVEERALMIRILATVKSTQPNSVKAAKIDDNFLFTVQSVSVEDFNDQHQRSLVKALQAVPIPGDSVKGKKLSVRHSEPVTPAGSVASMVAPIALDGSKRPTVCSSPKRKRARRCWG
jgi:hypothetical protein